MSTDRLSGGIQTNKKLDAEIARHTSRLALDVAKVQKLHIFHRPTPSWSSSV